jgi:hypothetical protein
VDVARKPQEPVRWSILILRAKAVWLGDVEAASEAEAIKIGAEQFGRPKERLMLSAVRERTAMNDDKQRQLNIEWMRIQPGVLMPIERAKLALILLAIAFALSVIEWVWPNAIRQALEPLKMLVSTLGF